MISPTHPVIVGAHELAVRTADAEPVAMMVEAANAALAETDDALRSSIESVRVVQGIWPYKDPGRLVSEQLGLHNVPTAITQIGGNAAYDLINTTAMEISAGRLRAALVCGAESMRTRRKDKAEGRFSEYHAEATNAVPDLTIGRDDQLLDDLDMAAGISHPVNFYAMADSAMRHERGETPEQHLSRISELWATGSVVAATNPHAWLRGAMSAEELATPSPSNRLVAAPYTKLLTSNINVDQGAAIVLCSYEAAHSAGIGDDNMVFVLGGAGAHDHLSIRQRDRLDRSPAFGASARRALEIAGTDISTLDHLDLYSCFPASVQLAQRELDVDIARPFTMTGGLTFAGGPFNGYCTQAIAHATKRLRGTAESAFLYGNGGFFSKHSVLIVSGAPPSTAFEYDRPQAEVDATPRRTLADVASLTGTVEAYTVTYDRANTPHRAILSVLDHDGSRHWAECLDADTIDHLLDTDAVGGQVKLTKRAATGASGRAAVAEAKLT